ncbi:hypothetical protein TNCV_1425731 [Trichonephila clavipes]|nr:hypothetical protein TNCV_1425731 [Trichonephila clavipes]
MSKPMKYYIPYSPESKLPYFSSVNATENRVRLRIEAKAFDGWFLRFLKEKWVKILGEPTPLATNRKKRQARTRWRQANPTMAARE